MQKKGRGEVISKTASLAGLNKICPCVIDVSQYTSNISYQVPTLLALPGSYVLNIFNCLTVCLCSL